MRCGGTNYLVFELYDIYGDCGVGGRGWDSDGYIGDPNQDLVLHAPEDRACENN